MNAEQTSLRVLWLEDNEDDVFFVMNALERSGVPLSIRHVWNGREGLDLLCSGCEPTPDAIVTDIRMPMMDGLAFIREVRSNPAFDHIPVLILSTSGLSKDVQTGLDLGACGYFTKPNVPMDWCTRLREIHQESLRHVASRQALCNAPSRLAPAQEPIPVVADAL